MNVKMHGVSLEVDNKYNSRVRSVKINIFEGHKYELHMVTFLVSHFLIFRS